MQKIIKFLLCLIGTIGFGVLFVSALWMTNALLTSDTEGITITKDSVAVGLLVIAVVSLLFYLLYCISRKREYRQIRKVSLIAAVGATVFTMILVTAAGGYPVADQASVFSVVNCLFTGDFTDMKEALWYFNAYPQQLGMAYLYLPWMKIAGRCAYIVAQTVQAACVGVIVYAGSNIVWRLFHNVTVSVYYLFMMISFLPLYLYPMFLYGETFGITFAMLAIWILLRMAQEKEMKRSAKVIHGILFFLCTIIAYTAREALLIVWIAMLCALIFRREHKTGLLFILVVAVLGVSTLVPKGLSQLVQKQANVELADGMPVILWIAMGLQDGGDDKGPGSYNDFNINAYYEAGYNKDKSTEIAMWSIRNSVHPWKEDPIVGIRFLYGKVTVQWCEPSYDSFFSTSTMKDPAEWVRKWYTSGYDFSYVFLNQWQNICYLGIVFYFLSLWKRKTEWQEYLPGFLLVGELMFSVLWESMSRYVYPYIVIALPAAAYGYYWLCRMISKKLRRES